MFYTMSSGYLHINNNIIIHVCTNINIYIILHKIYHTQYYFRRVYLDMQCYIITIISHTHKNHIMRGTACMYNKSYK